MAIINGKDNRDDTLVDTAGDDQIFGFGGNDRITVTGGVDSVSGGAGIDTLVIDYSAMTDAVYNTSGPGVGGTPDGGLDGQFYANGANRVDYSSIEKFNITTGSGNDTITTSSGDDVVKTGAGNDVVNVGAGLDVADGGADVDIISADLSAVTTAISWNVQTSTITGAGTRSFKNFEAFGVVVGGSAGDTLVSGLGGFNESLSGGGGDDTISVFGGIDSVAGGAGVDTLVIDYSAMTDAVYNTSGPNVGGTPDGGLDGQFYANGANRVDYTSIEKFNITTGSGNDTITTSSGDDVVKTGAGNDVVNVGAGLDVADGGADVDIISADLSAVTTAISWNVQTSTITGAGTRSFKNFEAFGAVVGGSAGDTLVSGLGSINESLSGGGGDDSLAVFGGIDSALGGAGVDTLVINYSSFAENVFTTSGPGANGSGDGGFDGQIYVNGGNYVSYSSIDKYNITTGAGNDTLATASGDDIVKTGAGNDFVNVGAGKDTADGGADVDGISADLSTLTTAVRWDMQANTFSGGGRSFTNFEYFGTITTGSGNDTLVTTSVAADESIWTGGGNDTVTIVNGRDGVVAGQGSDTLVIDYSSAADNVFNNSGPSPNGTDGGFDGQFYANGGRYVGYSSIEAFVVTTGAGNDSITTATGNDVVKTNDGDDFVNVGSGTDRADGGAGTDGISADLTDAVGGVIWNLQANAFAGGPDSFTNFEYFGAVATGGGNDTLVTTSIAADESISTGGGNDTVTIVNGRDSVTGGQGSDTLVIDYSSAAESVFNNGGPTPNGSDGGFDGQFYANGGRYVGYSSIEAFVVTTGTGNDSITTATGNDVVKTNDGNDFVNVGSGADSADGGAGIDGISADLTDAVGGVIWNLQTNAFIGGPDSFANFEYFGTVTTGSGNDTLVTTSVAADESISTGGGNDTVTVVNGRDGVASGQGSDTLVLDYSSAADNVFNNGGPTPNGVDGGFDGQFYANGGRYVGYSSIETFIVTTGTGFDSIVTADGDDVVRTNAGNDAVFTGAGKDLVEGGDGDDTLNGGDDLDTVSYASAASAVTVDLRITAQQDTLGAGRDTLANFENLTGSSFADTLTGTDAANIIDGGVGGDAMTGLGGDDTYLVDEAGDTVTEAADGGTDLVRASLSYTLGAEVENLTLTGSAAIDGTGNAGANVITGNDAANTIDGKAGADTMAGLGGNDTYVVDDSGDIVTEGASGGVDLVKSSVSFTLGAEVENLTLTGVAAIDGTGNGLANVLTGNDAANMLDGSVGADTMAGMGGDDTYVVDDAGDVVTEAANAGVDTVRSSITYTLGANLEKLILIGGAAINGTGNDLVNALTGNDAANILDGKGGADVMTGLGGNDTYVVDAGADTIVEAVGGGVDQVLASATYTLAAEIENLTLTGAAAINGTGNDLANTITGNGANNTIEGAGGDDTLDGGAGVDTASYSGALSGVTVSLAASGQQATGGAGADTLSNFENLTGSAFNDVLTGSAGANTLSGGGNDDTLIGGGGADRLMGGTGTDTAVYSGSFADYDVSLANGVYTVVDRRGGAPDGTDTLTGVERVTLSSGTFAIADVVNQGPSGVNDPASVAEAGHDGPGTPNASGNVLANDLDPNLSVAGLGERLSVTGARLGTSGAFMAVSGPTIVQGVYGTLTINADGSYSYALDNSRAATDQLAPGQVAQDVFSYSLADLHGVASQATLTVSVTGADDTVASADTLQVTLGRTSSLDASVLLANDAGATGETLTVTQLLNVAGGTAVLVDGRLQITAASASGGFDYVVTTSGGGTATGHVDFSALTPGKKFTAVAPAGVTAVDYVGGAKGDQLTGGAGDDRLIGDGGGDKLDGGAGADRMEGGAGSDTYYVDNVGDQVIETEPGGKDTVITTLASFTLGANLDRLIFSGTGDFVGVGNDDRNIITGGGGNDTMSGAGGVDRIEGGDGDDVLSGGDNADRLEGGAGDDVLDGGAGPDTAAYNGTAGVTVDLRITTQQDTIGAGKDTLTSIENLIGSRGDDTLNGSDTGNILNGGGGRDTISGNGGADTLIGGGGADVLSGGAGRDSFAYLALNELNGDRIADFSHAEHDVIDLSAVDADASVDGVQHFSFIGTAAFTGAGGSAYELRYQPAGTAGDLILQGDVNHDGLADFSLTVHASTLQSSDFLLTPPASFVPG